MSVSREEFSLLLQIDQAYRPGRDAKMFVWSDAVKIDGHEFFDRYGWDSHERMHINEYASYFEVAAMAWRHGLISTEVIDDWIGAFPAWEKVGHILLAAREILGDPQLWSGFEALAEQQRPRSAQ